MLLVFQLPTRSKSPNFPSSPLPSTGSTPSSVPPLPPVNSLPTKQQQLKKKKKKNSFVGLAACLTCIGQYLEGAEHFANDPSGSVDKVMTYAGTFIGGVTVTGSLVAFGKLDNRMDSRPINLPQKNLLNLGGAGATLALGAGYMVCYFFKFFFNFYFCFIFFIHF